MMTFIWIALVYVIVAFADITAGSFVSAVDEIKGTKVDFNPGGAVAAALTSSRNRVSSFSRSSSSLRAGSHCS